MHASGVAALLAALLLGGCGDGRAPVLGARPAAPPAPASPVAWTPPLARAPSVAEQLRACAVAPPENGLVDDLSGARFAELEAAIDVLVEAYAADPSCERHSWDVLNGLAAQDLELLDRWVRERPRSWAALTARGGHRINAGYASRGRRLARDVSEAQWQGMREAFARSDADLRGAIELRPEVVVPYGYRIWRLRASGREDEVLATLEAALAQDPLSAQLRINALEALSPDWGGSVDAMDGVASDAQRFAERNPRLRILLGYVQAARALEVWRAGDDLQRAAELYRRALAYGEHDHWYNGRAKILNELHEWKALLDLAEPWIAFSGDGNDWPWTWRGRARQRLGDLTGALEDYDRALALEPGDWYTLVNRATVLKHLGQLEEAFDGYERGLAAKPGDAWTTERLAETRALLADRAQGARTMPGLSRLGLTSAGAEGERR